MEPIGPSAFSRYKNKRGRFLGFGDAIHAAFFFSIDDGLLERP